jgi:hypothetical protein
VTQAISTPVYTLGPWQGNVVDDYGVAWIVEAEDGWSSSPPIRATLAERGGADGAWAGPGYYSARVINLKGRAIAADRATMLAAKDRIKAAITARTPATLQVAEEHLTRSAQVRLSDQVDLSDQGARAFNWSLTVVAPDPRRYDANPAPASTGLPSEPGGRSYPRTYPYNYGAYSPGQTGAVVINQAGDYDLTPAQITIRGPVMTPKVAHVQTGRSLTFDLTLAADQTLVLDLGAQTALLNGTASRAGTIMPGSAWFLLVPGTNEIQFRGTDTDPAADPLMTVVAASAWT